MCKPRHEELAANQVTARAVVTSPGGAVYRVAAPDSSSDSDEGSVTVAERAPDLLTRLKAGDAEARVELVVRYERLVMKIVWRTLGSRSESEDTVHDVFVEALEKIEQVHHPEALTVWVMRVTTSVVRSVLRRRVRRRRIQLVAPHDMPERPAFPVDVSARETLRHLYATLDRLPDPERMAFSLRYLCNFPLAETAQCCRCSLATIKRRLARAERKFLELAATDALLWTRIQRGSRWGNV
jgi:RNA polymerase sigma-70 factor (ECF subfamily)